MVLYSTKNKQACGGNEVAGGDRKRENEKRVPTLFTAA